MIVDVLERISAHPEAPQFRALGQLLKQLRAPHPRSAEEAGAHVALLINLLDQRPDLLAGLQTYLARLLITTRHTHLYTETGILGSETLIQGVTRRLSERILPPVRDDLFLNDAFSRLIRAGRDSDWIQQTDPQLWAALITRVINPTAHPRTTIYCRQQQLQALRILAHRVSALGLEPELVRQNPSFETVESPFMALAVEAERYVRHQSEWLAGHREAPIDHLQVEVLLDQCQQVIRKARRQASQEGVSVSLTYLLVRIEQNLARMALLINFLTVSQADLALAVATFIQAMSLEERQDHSIRGLFSRNTELLARNITEHAGAHGEHYITATRREFYSMYRSASKAGAVIAVMALLKVLMGRLTLAPIGQALLTSLNYSLGFMLIHVIRGTVATKQPAMTASKIAAHIEEVSEGKRAIHNLGALADLCIQVFRTQWIAIMGNITWAFPVALLIGWSWVVVTGSAPSSPEKAARLLHELNPIASLALFHAAIAGVCLFLAGIISGYYDNMALYSQVPERIAAHRWLSRLSVSRRVALTRYLRHNLGALAGNFYFGLMLGSMATLGFILGLPLDIRHIAFASANFAYALVALDFQVTPSILVWSLIGIAGIGLTNLGVSFFLALALALKSRGVVFPHRWHLLKTVIRRAAAAPKHLFWPPR